MDHLEQAQETVKELNDAGYAAFGHAGAYFTANESALSIEWNGVPLWHSEGCHREDGDYGDDEGFDPTLDCCIKSLISARDELSKLIAELTKGGDS